MRARWLAILLGVSVAVNLFCVGWLSARALQQRAEPRPERALRDAGGPGPRRGWQRPRPFDWMSDDERAELRPRRKGLRSARREAAEALRAEPFDAERLRRALGALRAETGAIQASTHEYLVRRASTMAADERRHLADTQWGFGAPARGEGGVPPPGGGR